ncbi:hypothetical protein QCM77_45475, partial [Bradyrhizobium sp. SSUT18]|uniref:hypothetical protein n=1 Tax=Bradyrhizobium sp. SSUT18 TaxID=3040602 RepID=UPI0024492552
TKRLHLRPLGVRQNESLHPKLLSELESRTFQSVNPESQQTLARVKQQRRAEAASAEGHGVGWHWRR